MNNSTNNNEEHSSFEELKKINTLIDTICRIREKNHMMATIINELIKYTKADQGVINLVHLEENDNMETIIRGDKKDKKSTDYKVHEQIAGWVLKNKSALFIEKLEDDDRFSSLDPKQSDFKSIICCPMHAHGEIIGLTTLVRNETTTPFTKDDLRLSAIISTQSAQILKNALILEVLAEKNRLLIKTQQALKKEISILQSGSENKFSFENIIGKSLQHKNILALVSKVSQSDSPVLITGPTGTGKELIARAIHFNSQRKDNVFVVKNCGLKTETLLESELFGHVKGAFTGAAGNKIGLFKEADGGTIFLDEIGDAPLSTQVAILRVIQSGEIRPVGSTKTEHVNVRVLSATNQNLNKMIEDNSFRSDLFYRLNTVTIELPPLAYRKEDIKVLTDHFIKLVMTKYPDKNITISDDAFSLLEQYSWPGNIRQLEHEIERASILCGIDGIIRPEDLSPEIAGTSKDVSDFKSRHGYLKDIVEDLEKDIITKTLKNTRNNILQSSKILGLTRKGLKDKISRYNINSSGADDD